MNKHLKLRTTKRNARKKKRHIYMHDYSSSVCFICLHAGRLMVCLWVLVCTNALVLSASASFMITLTASWPPRSSVHATKKYLRTEQTDRRKPLLGCHAEEGDV